MKLKNLKSLLLWIGVGVVVTTTLFAIQSNHNSKYKFVPRDIKGHKYIKPMSEKLNTYYEISGAITIGGALIILSRGLSKRNNAQ